MRGGYLGVGEEVVVGWKAELGVVGILLKIGAGLLLPKSSIIISYNVVSMGGGFSHTLSRTEGQTHANIGGPSAKTISSVRRRNCMEIIDSLRLFTVRLIHTLQYQYVPLLFFCHKLGRSLSTIYRLANRQRVPFNFVNTHKFSADVSGFVDLLWLFSRIEYEAGQLHLIWR